MKKFNKATASAIAGALATIVASFVEVEPEVLAAAQTLVVTILVYLIPNEEA